jgi:FkbM family methyltransferase
LYADWPEFHELMFVRRLLRRDELVLDVGANVGHVSLLLADVVGPSGLVAFEPTPVAFARLTENWRLNGWPTHQLYQVAVGGSDGVAHFEDVSSPATTSAVLKDAPSGTAVTVPMKPLDHYRLTFGDRGIGLLKVDVEGYESECFRGARRLLEYDRPGIVMFECLTRSIPDSIGKILDEAEYRAFGLDESGVPNVAALSAQNLFAVPREQSPMLCRPTPAVCLT